MERESAVRFARARSRWGRLAVLAVAVGLLAGLAAKVLHAGIEVGVEHGIGRYTEPGGYGILSFRWGVLLLPALGGLLSGVAVSLFCRPSALEGTGIVVDSFHHRAGEVGLRNASIKAGLAVFVISLGGSVGIEGVITVLGAAIGSTVAAAAGLPARERRLFLLAGCAAGVGAVFQCPLGGALFATTILYREPEIEADALLPSLAASVTSYSTFMAFGGYGGRLLPGVESLAFRNPLDLAAYAVLGALCAGAAALLYHGLGGVRALAAKSRLPAWLLPAAAGLAVGALACALPQVVDARYEFLRNAVQGSALLSGKPRAFWTLLFGLLVLAKTAATALAIGTRTAGGIFGPAVFLGGAVGGFAGELAHLLFPGFFPESLSAALIPVGMAGVLAAVFRVPLAAIVMVTEMTGSYGLIVPLMLVSVVAYALGRRWGIDPEQLRGPEESPAHAGEAVVGILESAKVRDLVAADWPHTVKPETRMADLVARFPAGSRPLVAVVDGARLVGVISAAELAQAGAVQDPGSVVLAADLMAPPDCAVGIDDELYASLDAFRRTSGEAVPVLDGRGFAGVLTRAAVLDAVRKGLDERRSLLLREHEGLTALDHEGRLQDLLDEFAAPAHDAVRRLPVPEGDVGKSLRDLDFRKRHKAQVIAIETAAEGLLSPPDPQRPLKKDDVLVVLPVSG